MPALVILAAGMGKRYGGNKQVDAVGPHSQRILDYSIYDALLAGFDQVVFVIRRDIESAFAAFIRDRYASRAECRMAYQDMDAPLPGGKTPGRTKPWGTGHAVLVSGEAVRGPFCVINADDFYGREAYRRMAEFLAIPEQAGGPARFGMVGFRLANTLSESGAVSRGVCEVGPDNRLVSVTERTRIERDGTAVVYREGERVVSLSGEEPVSLNFWGFTPRIFPRLEEMFAEFAARHGDDPKAEFFLPAAVDRMIRQGEAEVTVLPSHERWAGVTYPEDRETVAAHIRALTEAGVYPERLW
jgi:dTDP-glucose pyrophosphorylase